MQRIGRFIKALVHRLLVAVGAVGFTLAFFMVLPLLESISAPAKPDLLVRSADTADVPPPPPLEEEDKKEPEPEKEPPKLTEESPPLDLSQLEMALNPGFGDGGIAGDFAVKLASIAGGAGADDGLFSVADLDRPPRVLSQANPVVTDQMRRKAPGTVHIIFLVDKHGRVENPIVQRSTDPVFDAAAVQAVKQWKFEPGSRNGQPVRFRMRVPLTFPKD
jgi:protein TonB